MLLLEAPKAKFPALNVLCSFGFSASLSVAVAPNEKEGNFLSDAGVDALGVDPKEKRSVFFVSLSPPRGAAPKVNFGFSASFSASSLLGALPKVKVGAPGFARDTAGAGFLAFSISSATAATALSLSFLFLAKNEAGQAFTAGVAGVGDPPIAVSSCPSAGKGTDAAATAFLFASLSKSELVLFPSSETPLVSPKEKLLLD
mmetsp:Transcript_10099/g.28615  ORF Transcript_10099/g.28615 Transcript_10099/m.28615 type:complete len:201 (+) Transcript_10099:2557-3159(+)